MSILPGFHSASALREPWSLTSPMARIYLVELRATDKMYTPHFRLDRTTYGHPESLGVYCRALRVNLCGVAQPRRYSTMPALWYPDSCGYHDLLWSGRFYLD